MSRVYNKRYFLYRCAKYLVLLQGILFLIGSLFYSFGCDEMECMRTAYFVYEGMVIYKDFFQHHNPLAYYFYSLPFYFLQDSFFIMIWGRIFSLIFFCCSGVALFKIAKLFFEKNIAMIALFLFFSWKSVFLSGYQIRPDIAQMMFAVWALYGLLLFEKEQRYKFLFLSGIAGGLAFLALQKIIIVLGVYFLYLFYLGIKKKLNVVYLWLTWLFGATLPIGLFFLYYVLIKQGSLYDYFICNYRFNALLAPSLMAFLYSILHFIKNFLLCDQILWLLIIGAVLTKNFHKIYFLLVLFIMSFILALSASSAPQYHLLYCFFGSIIAAFSLYQQDCNENYKLTAMLFLVFFSFQHLLALRPLSSMGQWHCYQKYQKYLHSNSYVMSNNNMFFFYQPTSYMWFFPHSYLKLYEKISGFTLPSVLNNIEEFRPGLIDRYTLTTEELSSKFIMDHYYQMPDYEGILILK